MSERLVASRYAKAYFDIGVENDVLADLEAELRTILTELSENPDLKTRLEHPKVSKEEKFSILDEAFSDRVSYRTMNLLRLLVEKRRERYVEAIYQEFLRLYDEARGIVVAKVRSAIELDEETESAISGQLASALGKQVRLELEVDPGLLGGLIVQIGDRRLDASLRRQLQSLKDYMAAGGTDMEVSRA